MQSNLRARLGLIIPLISWKLNRLIRTTESAATETISSGRGADGDGGTGTRRPCLGEAAAYSQWRDTIGLDT